MYSSDDKKGKREKNLKQKEISFVECKSLLFRLASTTDERRLFGLRDNFKYLSLQGHY